jgi:hypothetical protein
VRITVKPTEPDWTVDHLGSLSADSTVRRKPLRPHALRGAGFLRSFSRFSHRFKSSFDRFASRSPAVLPEAVPLHVPTVPSSHHVSTFSPKSNSSRVSVYLVGTVGTVGTPERLESLTVFPP